MTVRAWPLMRRDALIHAVADLLAGGSNVVLTGPAGMGKTTLADAVALDYPGPRHRIVGSPSASAVPLAPVASLVGDALGGAAVLAARASLGLGRPASSATSATPPLLVVDDINGLDDASATVLHQLLADGETRLVGTLRSGVSTSSAVDRLRRSLSTVEVTVPPLTEAEVVSMTERALGAPLTAPARARLASSAQGNPMYARELVEGSLAAGTLAPTGSGYAFRGDPVGTLQLEELVLARLAPLGRDQHRALEYLAVGGRLPHPVLDALIPAADLEDLERAGLIIARPDAPGLTIDVGHPLYRDMTRARLGPLSRMRIFRELADALERAIPAATRSQDDHLRFAAWSVRSGAKLTPDAAVAAARRAIASGDTELAVELADHAAQDPDHAEAAIFAAHCASITGRHAHAAALLTRVKAQLTDPWARTAVLLKLAEEVWGTGDLAAGAEALAEASRLGGESQALVTASQAVHAVLGGQSASALAEARPLLRHEHPGVRYSACVAAATALIFTDRADEAIATARAYLDDPGQADIALVGDPAMPQALLLMAQLVAGEVAQAGDAARQRFELAPLESSAQANAWATMLVGLAAEASGDLDWAARTLAEGERAWVDLGIWGSSLWCGSLLVRTLAQRGDLEGARAALVRVSGYPRMPGYIGNRYLPFAQAWVDALAGDRAAAASALAGALSDARATSQWTGWFEAWHEAGRLGLLDLLPPDADPPAPNGRLSGARAALVAGLRSGDPALLSDAAERFRSCGTLLYAAEAAAAAHRAAGDGRAATASDKLTATLQAEVPAAETPLLGRARPRTGPLSPREREIAALAAGGLSNRAIADRLVVSERTVENHLYRVFIKLGVTGRDQLAGVLGR